MSALIAATLGAMAGLGLFVAFLGLRGVEPTSSSPVTGAVSRRLRQIEHVSVRCALALFAAAFMYWITGWIVGCLMAALGAATAPTFATARAKRRAVVRRTEAIATWTEMLRDTIASASGLREAVAVTAQVAPTAIAAEVQELAVRLRSERFSDAMIRFANALADPTADKVVVALVLASERRGQRLGDVLSEVAAAARGQAEMHLRAEAARARTYTQALTVTIILIVMFVAMLLFSRDYLAAYDTAGGQLVLLFVLLGWAFAFWGLVQLSRVRLPERTLSLDGPELGSRVVT